MELTLFARRWISANVSILPNQSCVVLLRHFFDLISVELLAERSDHQGHGLVTAICIFANVALSVSHRLGVDVRPRTSTRPKAIWPGDFPPHGNHRVLTATGTPLEPLWNHAGTGVRRIVTRRAWAFGRDNPLSARKTNSLYPSRGNWAWRGERRGGQSQFPRGFHHVGIGLGGAVGGRGEGSGRRRNWGW